jgi:hypothetical protein
MGRPLIYICAATILVLGIIQININNRHFALGKRTVQYANSSEMTNLAHSGVEMTLNKLREDISWRNDGKPYEVALDYGTAMVTVYDSTTDGSLAPNHLRLVSEVIMEGESRSVDYTVEVISPKLPEIPAAIAITTGDFTIDLSGSFEIDGNDEEKIVKSPLAGVTVLDKESAEKVSDAAGTKSKNIKGKGGSPSIEVDNAHDFEAASYLIEMLATNAKRLNSNIDGNYNSGDLGSADAPGVFFVDDYARINGNTQGYGIMVVKKGGTLNLRGTFDFYGLVLFEDKWGFDSAGTPVVHGSIMLGTNTNSGGASIVIKGNASIRYNSYGVEIAEKAAKFNIPSTFKVVDVYE